MNMHFRTILTALAVVTTATSLAGCALLGTPRGEDGRVTESATINSAALLVGDCFSFVDGTNLGKSIVTPCTEPHAYIVIDQGELDAAAIDAAGGLQNAVNAACDEPFAAFKAAAAEGVKPEPQFIVSSVERNGKKLTAYSCVATDGA
jgi:hypothetical protein